MINNNQRLSDIIYFLRFPLAVMVVMMHSDFDEISMGGARYVFKLNDYPFYLNISFFISNLLVRFAVPTYFIFTGYLFFRGGTQFNKEFYYSKLKRRIKSLLPPYIFWNLEVLVIFFLAQSFLPYMTSGNNTLIKDYSISGWLMVFWTPICGQFWYIRDILIAFLLSPILFCFIKKWGVFFVGGLGALWIMGVRHEPMSLNTTSLFFFTLGALFPIKRYDLLEFVRKVKILCYSLCALYIMSMIVLYNLGENNELLRNLETIVHFAGLIFLIATVLSVTDFLIQKGCLRTNEFLNKSSFFIYAYHGMPLLFLIKILIYALQPISDSRAIFVYIFSPITTIVFGLFLYGVMKKFFPKFTMLITGNRA